MPYTFHCDACGTQYNHAPPFMGEFREAWLKTTDSPLSGDYKPGQTVTMCRACMEGFV